MNVSRSEGQLGPVPGKCGHCQGCKPATAPKPTLNSKQFHRLNNYLKKHSNKNLSLANSEQHTQSIYRKEVHGQREESRHKEDLEQKREKSEPWNDVEHEERSMQWKEFMEANKKEQNTGLELGEELGCGEELAQGSELDWEVGLDQAEGFDSEEGDGSLELLSDSCSDRDEEVQGVARQLHREEEREEGWEVVRNGKTGSLMTPVDIQFAMKSSPYGLEMVHKGHKDGMNRNKAQTSMTFSDNIYDDAVVHDKIFSNGLYPSHIYLNGIGTDELCPDRIDTGTMFPDMCDAGEALADADGLSECDLFENTEPSQILEAEEVGDPGDAVMLSVEEGSESSTESLSAFEEEGGEEEKSDQRESQDLHSGTSQDSPHSGSVVCPKSEREAGILSESSHQPSSSLSSFCSSVSEVTSDEEGRTEAVHKCWRDQDEAEPETDQAVLSQCKESDFRTTFELDLPCVSSPVLPEEQKSLQMCDEEEEYASNEQEGQLIKSRESSEVHTEEHVYEETEPKFQTKAFLQTRKYLMTRSISVEPPSNRLDPVSSTVSGKERLMLHPQSYYTNHNFLGDSLPAITRSLGCLSPGNPRPPSDLNITTVDIPPPFELSSITKRPIRKSTPALPTDVSASCRKLDFGFKRYFLPLRFLRKSERRSLADNRSVSSRSSSESSPQGSFKRSNLIRQNMGSPELCRVQDFSLPSTPSPFLYQKNKERRGLSTPLSNNVMSATPSSWDIDDLLHSSFTKAIPFSKPRSFSSPNVDSSVYENVLNPSPHYENVQLRLLSPSNHIQRNQSSANDIDGYVDMSSLPGFPSKNQSSDQETERYNLFCFSEYKRNIGVEIGRYSAQYIKMTGLKADFHLWPK